MSLIQAVLNEFMPCGGSVCRGCEVECAHGGHINGGRTPDVNSMADALIEAREQRDALRTQLAAARLENDTQRRAMSFWENYAMPHELPFLHRLRSLAPEQQDELLRFGQTLKAMTITAALSEATP
jgi:hypothetical protein